MGMTLNQDKTKENKQFKLVKCFALASFAVLIIFSFPYSIFISKKAKDRWFGENGSHRQVFFT